MFVLIQPYSRHVSLSANDLPRFPCPHVSKSKTQYRTLEKDGSYGYISASRARFCLSAGYASLVRKHVIEFKEQPAATHKIAKPVWGAQLKELLGNHIPAADCDSGFGFLRYPQPAGGSGIRFPALFKAGAGL